MAGELTLFEDDGAEAQVPAHILAAFGASDNTDLSAGVSTGFPIISYKGKVWHVVQGGVRTLVADANGDPRPSIEVVIIKSNPHISKLYYDAGYTEGSTEAPTCYSHDGIVPALDAKERQSPKCAICPHNAWGSRITENGAKGKSCADSRRLAVSPSGDLENPHLLRVPAGSLKDLVAYADMLMRRKTPYQAVVTKISFDHTVAHQKLTFKAVRWLEPAEVAIIGDVMAGPIVQAIIGDTVADGEAAAETIAGERPANVAVLDAPAASKPKKSEVSVEDIAAALASKPAAPVVEKAAPKAAGFGADDAKAASAALLAEATAATKPAAPAEPVETEAQKKRRLLMAEMAALEAEEAKAAAEPAAVVTQVVETAPAADKHQKLLQEATASLDEVLGALDD